MTRSKRISGADRERRNRSYITENNKKHDENITSNVNEPSKLVSSEKSPTGMVSGADRERRNRSYKTYPNQDIPSEITNNFAVDPFVGNTIASSTASYTPSSLSNNGDISHIVDKEKAPTGKVHGADKERRNRSYK